MACSLSRASRCASRPEAAAGGAGHRQPRRQFLQRKQIEQSLRESEARFRSLTEMSSTSMGNRSAARVTNIAAGANYSADHRARRRRQDAVGDPGAESRRAQWANTRQAWTATFRSATSQFLARHRRRGHAFFSLTGERGSLPTGRSRVSRRGRDITETAHARRIEALAYSDPLTGLANRTSSPGAGASRRAGAAPRARLAGGSSSGRLKQIKTPTA